MELNDKYRNIFVDRGTNAENSMKTVNVLKEIPSGNYVFENKTIVKCSSLQNKNNNYKSIIKYNYNCNLIGLWQNDQNSSKVIDEMNVLGFSGEFKTSQISLIISKIKALQENLDFFGVKILKNGDIFKFETPQTMALTQMTVGKHYVEETLMKNSGFYLESHDLPHLHIPLNSNSNGYIIFAKKMSAKKYVVNAVKIPVGCAIYTPPNVLHCDAFLIGDFKVCYGVTKNYSTNNFYKINVNII
jgi:hypothetical protein